MSLTNADVVAIINAQAYTPGALVVMDSMVLGFMLTFLSLAGIATCLNVWHTSSKRGSASSWGVISSLIFATAGWFVRYATPGVMINATDVVFPSSYIWWAAAFVVLMWEYGRTVRDGIDVAESRAFANFNAAVPNAATKQYQPSVINNAINQNLLACPSIASRCASFSQQATVPTNAEGVALLNAGSSAAPVTMPLASIEEFISVTRYAKNETLIKSFVLLAASLLCFYLTAVASFSTWKYLPVSLGTAGIALAMAMYFRSINDALLKWKWLVNIVVGAGFILITLAVWLSPFVSGVLDINQYNIMEFVGLLVFCTFNSLHYVFVVLGMK